MKTGTEDGTERKIIEKSEKSREVDILSKVD